MSFYPGRLLGSSSGDPFGTVFVSCLCFSGTLQLGSGGLWRSPLPDLRLRVERQEPSYCPWEECRSAVRSTSTAGGCRSSCRPARVTKKTVEPKEENPKRITDTFIVCYKAGIRVYFLKIKMCFYWSQTGTFCSHSSCIRHTATNTNNKRWNIKREITGILERHMYKYWSTESNWSAGERGME